MVTSKTIYKTLYVSTIQDAEDLERLLNNTWKIERVDGPVYILSREYFYEV